MLALTRMIQIYEKSTVQCAFDAEHYFLHAIAI